MGKKCYGFDCGTYTLVCAERDEKGVVDCRHEINAFLELMLKGNDFVFNMMKQTGVPLILREDSASAYALGEAAVEMAYTMPTIELKRPMKDGCVNPKEVNAFQIMKIMMHSLLEDIKEDGVLYYTIPANAINVETDADYHNKILEAIFKAYKSSTGKIVEAHPINEALALVYAELGTKNFTGIAMSFGAGMVNVCFAMFGAPVFSFAIANSGDWIDQMAAKATNEAVAYINKEKKTVDLMGEPKTLVDRAIQTQYRLMLEKTMVGLKKGFSDNAAKARLDTPIDIVIAGGTSMPKGFDVMFKEVLASAQLPVKVGSIIRPAEPLFSVAKGALIAAENAKI